MLLKNLKIEINTYKYKPFTFHTLHPMQQMCVVNLLRAAASVITLMAGM